MRSPSETAAPPLGGKARRLVELQLAGFRVPDFLCAPRDLARAVEVLGFPLAVRSSASAEDGGDVSFAGQFRSYLNLESLKAVEAAVRGCVASVESPAVADYCRRHGLDPATLRMTPVVQRMVRPELAGVAFTVNPATGAEEVVIEACAGLADALLAGSQAALPADHPLLVRHRPEIECVARAIQRHFGAPQDIEFAIEDGVLHVLQARPVTRIGFAPGTGEWTNADFRDGGVSAGVCTPLMWSLYDFIWESALKDFLREVRLLGEDFPAGRMFFGRPYWNLGAVKRCLARLPGFVEREFDRDLSVAVTYDGDGIRTPVTPLGVLRALPTLLAVPGIWRRQERFDRAFLAGGAEALLRRHARLPDDLAGGFGRLIREDYRVVETHYFRTIFCASLAKLAFLESFPDADYPALVAALPPLRHLEPTRRMREMAARGERDVAALQREFPHRGRRELDLSAPRWDEDPAWVAGLLREQHRAPAGADPRPAYERARAAALAGLPWHRHRGFARKLDRLRTFLWLREEMRDVFEPDVPRHPAPRARPGRAAGARRRRVFSHLGGTGPRRPEPGDGAARDVRGLPEFQRAKRDRRALFLRRRAGPRGAAGHQRQPRTRAGRRPRRPHHRGGRGHRARRDSRVPVHGSGLDAGAGPGGRGCDRDRRAAFPRGGDLPRVRHSGRARRARCHPPHPRRRRAHGRRRARQRRAGAGRGLKTFSTH